MSLSKYGCIDVCIEEQVCSGAGAETALPAQERFFPRARARAGFTLIELVVAVAVVSILAVVVILTVNPGEKLKEARDSQRISEFAAISEAISFLQLDQPAASIGNVSTTYVSVPDPVATSTAGDQCQGLGLPSLPSGWTYHCAATSTYRNTNGAGWLPTDFTTVSFKSPFGALPVDPVNNATSRDYYAYAADGNGKYELAASLESAKYKLGGASDKVSTDGGSYVDLYEVGSNLALEPVDYGDTSLVGYWRFDEGSGSTAYDASGKGNNGTWSSGSPTWSASGCESNACLSESGDGNYFSRASNSLLSPGGNLSLLSWFQAGSSTTAFWILKNGEYGFQWKGPSAALQVYDGQYHGTAKTSWNLNEWYQVAMVINDSTVNVYVDGVSDSTFAADTRSFLNGSLTIGDSLGTFVGFIDTTALYSRALSAAEIAAMYNATK